jgi:signal transduction histidine kinase
MAPRSIVPHSDQSILVDDQETLAPPSDQLDRQGHRMRTARRRRRLAGPVPPLAQTSVLLVGGQQDRVAADTTRLQGAGHRVLTAADSAVALDLFVRERADVLVVAQSVIDVAGAEFLRCVRRLDTATPVILRADGLDAQHRLRLMRALDLHGICDDAESGSSHLVELVESASNGIRRARNARAAQELRALILAKFCHELRNALHVVRGYSEILHGDPGATSVEGIVGRLEVASGAALGLAQDYLDLARLDAPGMIVRREAVDIDALLEDLRALSRRHIGTRPVRFTTDIPFPGAFVCTDGEKVRAILAQLLSNAIKFTPSGEVRLTVRPDAGRTDFILSDAGPGISPEALPDVLNPRYQFRNDPAATTPGQGVGLAIALRLSALIGASLAAQSDARGGAVFTLSLSVPMNRRADAPEPTLH